MNTDSIIASLNSGTLKPSDVETIATGQERHYPHLMFPILLDYMILVNGDRIHKSNYNPAWSSMGNNEKYLAECKIMEEIVTEIIAEERLTQ